MFKFNHFMYKRSYKPDYLNIVLVLWSQVDWTPELHKKFVKAVEQLGIDHAIPSRILDLMKVEGLTRHNVASHLQVIIYLAAFSKTMENNYLPYLIWNIILLLKQKYRMHKRHILPKQEDRKWLNQRDPMQRSYCLQRPIMPSPPYYPNHTLPIAPLYSMWGQSRNQTASMQVWGHSGYPLWQPTESWHWKSFPGVIYLFKTQRGYKTFLFLLETFFSGLLCRNYGYG